MLTKKCYHLRPCGPSCFNPKMVSLSARYPKVPFYSARLMQLTFRAKRRSSICNGIAYTGQEMSILTVVLNCLCMYQTENWYTGHRIKRHVCRSPTVSVNASALKVTHSWPIRSPRSICPIRMTKHRLFKAAALILQ